MTVINKQQDKQHICQPSISVEMQFQYERAILVMLIGDEKDTKRGYILSHLCGEMFMHRPYRIIYEIVSTLYELKVPINPYSIMEYLSNEHEREEIKDLYNEFISAVNCDFYLNKIITVYIDRMIEQAKSFSDLDRIREIQAKFALKKDMKAFSEVAKEMPNQYKEAKNQIIMPYPSIRKYIGTLHSGDVMVLAGGTGMGKTCMALNLMDRIQQKHKVSMYSLEMTNYQLISRIACAKLHIDSAKLRDRKLTPDEFKKFEDFTKTFDMNLQLCDKRDVTIPYIRSIEKNSGSELVIIDYLGLLKPMTKGKKYEVVSDLSREIKCLAGEINKPILLLHQINRDYMSREDKRPQLCDLRDSGNIEQDADFVCFVHRPAVVEEGKVDDTIEFIIRKNRFGRNNVGAELIFNGEEQRISDRLEVIKNADSYIKTFEQN